MGIDQMFENISVEMGLVLPVASTAREGKNLVASATARRAPRSCHSADSPSALSKVARHGPRT